MQISGEVLPITKKVCRFFEVRILQFFESEVVGLQKFQRRGGFGRTKAEIRNEEIRAFLEIIFRCKATV
jgi:hypothetical protein